VIFASSVTACGSGSTHPGEQTLWYYRSLVTFYRGNPNHHRALVDELDRTVIQIVTLVAEGS
jgi:hypothetical protein